MRDLQHHCDEQTEIIETMIEVEAEDKSHVRALKKDVQVSLINLEQLRTTWNNQQPKDPKQSICYFLVLTFEFLFSCFLFVLG